MNSRWRDDRIRVLFAVVLAEDGPGRRRRRTVTEAAAHVLDILPAGLLTGPRLSRILDDVLAGRPTTVPEPVLTGLADFFGVPDDYFGDDQVARTTDGTLLGRSFARLGVDAVVLCRTASAGRHHQLLRLVLDSALIHQA